MVTQPTATPEDEFTAFMRAAQPKVLVALTAAFGPETAGDASAEAFAYAWQHWDRVAVMENPAGYVYRVGRSRIKPSRRPVCPPPPENPAPLVEPKLIPALTRLSPRQRSVVVLTEGYRYTQNEVAEVLGIHPSSVRRHRERALRKLRSRLGVRRDA